MDDKSKKGWERDYQAFIETAPVAPPRALSEQLTSWVKNQLHPSALAVSLKLLVVHLFSSAITLTVCPQFGIGPVGGGHGLMGFVMSFGHQACALFCGALFLGTTAIVSQFVLRPEEARVVYRHQYWQFSLLAVLSLMTLMFISQGTSSPAPSKEFVALWLIAAVVGPLLFYRIGFRFRYRAPSLQGK